MHVGYLLVAREVDWCVERSVPAPLVVHGNDGTTAATGTGNGGGPQFCEGVERAGHQYQQQQQQQQQRHGTYVGDGRIVPCRRRHASCSLNASMRMYLLEVECARGIFGARGIMPRGV
uniref:Uncharacterized protein n=1 Tax=Globodera rostochiensis TaxID=31243 RepID=A0A914GV30_GLORO